MQRNHIEFLGLLKALWALTCETAYLSLFAGILISWTGTSPVRRTVITHAYPKLDLLLSKYVEGISRNLKFNLILHLMEISIQIKS